MEDMRVKVEHLQNGFTVVRQVMDVNCVIYLEITQDFKVLIMLLSVRNIAELGNYSQRRGIYAGNVVS